MTSQEYYVAFTLDARTAFGVFERMRTEELLTLQAAHNLDQAAATQPETIVFSAGRLALIAAVLKARAAQSDARIPSITCPVCHHVSYNPFDIAQAYCGFCHRFLDDPVPGAAR